MQMIPGNTLSLLQTQSYDQNNGGTLALQSSGKSMLFSSLVSAHVLFLRLDLHAEKE